MALAHIYPQSDDLIGSGWSGSFADVDDPYGTWNDADKMIWNLGSGNTAARFNMTNMPDAMSIQSVTVNARMAREASGGAAGVQGRVFVRVGGTNYPGTYVTLSTTFAVYSKVYALNPDTGLAWTLAEVNALLCGGEMLDSTPSGGFFSYMSACWADVTFIGAPAQIEAMRDAGTRRLRALATLVPRLELACQMALGCDVDPLSQILVGHHAGPHPTAQGWGPKPWELHPFGVESITEDPNPGTETPVTLTVRDRRPQLCLGLDYMWTGKGSAPSIADGVGRMSKGVARTFTRASNGWVDDAASRYLVQVGSDQERLNYGGTLIESASTNLIQYSGFQAGNFTQWSKAGTGSNGSAIANDTADTVWLWDQDSTSVLQTAKLTSGNPIHASDLQLSMTSPTTSILANTKVRVSIAHRDDTGSPLYVWIQRAVDARYWRESDSTWQVAKTWNLMPLSGSLSILRWTSKEIDVGGSNTTLTVAVGVPTASGVAGQLNHVAAAQAEARAFGSSFILSTNASQTRAAERLLISNNAGKRFWSNQQGAAHIVGLPGWSTADIGNTNKTLLYLAYDANNYEWVYYDGTNDRWVFERKVATVVARAVLAATLVQDTAYTVVPRWTGPNGELDLPNYTMSIFVDGVQGTDAVTAMAPVEAATCDLEVGSKASAEHWDGRLRKLHTFVQVPTPEECARLA